MDVLDRKRTETAVSTVVVTATPGAVEAQLVHMMIAKGMNLENHSSHLVSFGGVGDGTAFANEFPGGNRGKMRHRYTFEIAPTQGGTAVSVSGEVLRPTQPGNYLRLQLAPDVSIFSEWLDELRSKF
jgi:hypothetical protein